VTVQLLEGQVKVQARALLVGQRLNLRAFESAQPLATTPLTIAVGDNGCAVLFRYGVIVLFNVGSIEEVSFREHLNTLIIDPVEKIETEVVAVVLAENQQEGIAETGLVLQTFDLPRIQMLADVLAKSVVLAYYEGAVAASFDRVEPLAIKLQMGGRIHHHAKKLLQHLGDTLSIESKMVGRVEVSEKPELLWEHPELERLYSRLDDEYELKERHLALERKLDLISRTTQTLLSLLQNKRSLRVEWYIVFLILIEIVISVYEKLTA
jgi:uncharacterized Rmd1/YagE family protein